MYRKLYVPSGRSAERSRIGHIKTPQRKSGVFSICSKTGYAFFLSLWVQELNMAHFPIADSSDTLKAMPEKIPSSEFSSEEQALIAKLRERGLDDETRKELTTWTEAQEARANEVNTPRANIEMNVKRAKLYNAAEFMAEAWDVLESVRMQATNEDEDDLYAEAMRMMDEMDASGK